MHRETESGRLGAKGLFIPAKLIERGAGQIGETQKATPSRSRLSCAPQSPQQTSCELSLGCPPGPGRGSWSCDASASSGGPDEHAQECPAYSARSRADCTPGGERVDAGDRCGSRRGLSGHGSQVGGSISSGRFGGIAGSVIPAAPAAAADTPCSCRRHRAAAPAALDGQADRRRDRGLASHCLCVMHEG